MAQCCGDVLRLIEIDVPPATLLPPSLPSGPCRACAPGCSRQAHPAQPVTQGHQGGSSSAAKVMMILMMTSHQQQLWWHRDIAAHVGVEAFCVL